MIRSNRMKSLFLLIGLGFLLSACAVEPAYGPPPVYGYDYPDPVYGFYDGGWGGWHHGWDHGHGFRAHGAPGHFGHGFGGHPGFGGGHGGGGGGHR